jgi:hypothetical protein
LPALTSFGSSFIANGADGDGETAAGDHLQAVYRFWLVGDDLEHGRAPWRDPYSFQPLVEPQTVLGGWPFGFAFWPLEAAFGPVLAWNLLLFGTIVTAGLVTYGWLRALDLPAGAAAAGGLAFAIAPYRLAQSGVHLLGWVAIFLPLALLAFERARATTSRRRAHAWGAVAVAAAVSIPLSGQLHLALGALPFLVAYAVVRHSRLAAAWMAAAVVAAIGTGLGLDLTLVRGSAESGGRSLQEVGEFSSGWLDLVSRWQLDGFEQYAYLGWAVPVLAVCGIVLLWRRGERGLAALLAVGALVPPILALGTNLPLYEWLRAVFPPLHYPRVPGRLMPIADLAAAALAAVAVARLVAASGRRAAATALALLALVAADLLVFPLGVSVADYDNRAYAVLRTEPSGRTLELPLFEPGVHFGSVYDFHQLQAPRERPGGYSTLAPEETFDFYFARNRLSCGVWLPGDEATLRLLGIEYVTFHRGLYAQGKVPGAWFGWQGLLDHGFAPTAVGGPVTLFARGRRAAAAPVPEPSRTRLHFCQGWKGRTMNERQGPLWVYGSGAVRLHVSAVARTSASLWTDGQRVASAEVDGDAMLESDLAGRRWHALVLEVPALFETSPPRGLHLDRIELPAR